ncbi:DUF7373 family lipoprotein [Nocardia callitridis]|uniref:Uncharacterized protein n=1 Tax=Nocardia callitridis TaxID=648753 RepID=A0ABP9KX68_9NOCA
MGFGARAPLARKSAGVLVATALVFGLGGCGETEIAGHAIREAPDPSTLDVGNYPSVPRQIGNAKNDQQARARESQRLSDHVALPYEADPAYVEDAWGVRPHIVLNRKTLGPLVINDTFDEVAEDLSAGWVNAWQTGGEWAAPRRTMNLAVLEFPDAQIASEVGPTLEHDDFTYSGDNQPVPIPGHADTTAHWRPSINSIGSWTVHDRYVIFMKVVDDIGPPDLGMLVDQVQRMLAVQLPLLDQFQPTPADGLSRIPLDPQGLLGRTLPSDTDHLIRAEPDGVFTGRGSLSLMQAKDTTLPEMQNNGVDLVSFGDAVVFRSTARTGAEGLWAAWRPSTHLEPEQRMVEAPSGLGDNVECYGEVTPKSDPETIAMHLCVFQVDRYVVQAFGKQLQDLHQKIAAQYALLTSP